MKAEFVTLPAFFFFVQEGDVRSQALTEALLGRMATYMLPVQGVG